MLAVSDIGAVSQRVSVFNAGTSDVFHAEAGLSLEVMYYHDGNLTL
jgi:hypothetical protein